MSNITPFRSQQMMPPQPGQQDTGGWVWDGSQWQRAWGGAPTWPQQQCGPPSCFSATAKAQSCYDQSQALYNLVYQVVSDIFAKQPGIIPPPPPSAGSGPIIGVTDGSNAAPGTVGETIQSNTSGTFAAAVQTQAISASVLQPGDWDVFAWCVMSPATGSSVGIDGGWFSLQPVPTGMSNNMFVANMANPTAMNPTDLSAWLTLISPPSRLSNTIPTLLSFTFTTNPSATGAAGNFNFWTYARRVR